MQTFKDTVTGQVWQFEDDVADIHAFPSTPATLVPYTLPVPTTAELKASADAAAWATYQAQARAALAASDTTIIRCVENSVAVPVAWVSYRASLRSIVGAESGDPTQPLPAKPAYPAGT
ncbi:MAG: hypothetical protein ACYCZJ_13160 [Sulfuriferula sp.]